MPNAFSGGATPNIRSQPPFSTGRIGPFEALAFRDILPVAAERGGKVVVSYPLVLAVKDSRDDDDSVLLFVAVERGHLFGTCNLCVFERDGTHRNYGAWAFGTDTKMFIKLAAGLVNDHLNK